MNVVDQITKMVGMNDDPRMFARPLKLDRRTFLKASLTASGGLLLSLNLPIKDAFGQEAAEYFQPNPFIRIEPDNTITIWVARSEMGQGVRTGLPMIVCEELGVDWEQITIEQADANPKYGPQGTGGSRSVNSSWDRLRNAGAAAREMLVQAAANAWGVEPGTCRVEKAMVIHDGSGKKMSYGELAAKAADIKPPEEPTLTDPANFKLIGKSISRYDGPDIVGGKAKFGFDIKLPGMLYATIERCPVVGGRLKTFDDSETRKVAGVTDVVVVDPVGPGVSSPGGVAVVAKSTWAALQGRKALKVDWDLGDNANLTTEQYRQQFQKDADKDGVSIYSVGDGKAPLGNAADKIEFDYETAYQAHATMEPMNCTADVRADSCEVWAPTQFPRWAQWEIRRLLWLPADKVTVHVTLMGGGFGRRINPDSFVEAVQVSREVGAPVQVFWTRDDDIRHDFYHPASLQRMSAVLGEDKLPQTWNHRIIEPNHGVFFNADFTGEIDPNGHTPPYLPYDIANINQEYVFSHVPLRIGWWRGVDKIRHAWAMECFVDEVAHQAGMDPVDYRLKMLEKQREIKFSDEEVLHTERLKKVIQVAAEKAGWGKKDLPDGHALGFSCYPYIPIDAYAAEVVEISVSDREEVTVHRVVCVIDCGIAINPDLIKAQLEGGIVFALSAVLYPQLTVKDGHVEQSNFDTYEIPRIGEAPHVEVHIVESNEAPGGTGEPPIPPLAPAVANAVFAATGKRVRKIPILADDIRNA